MQVIDTYHGPAVELENKNVRFPLHEFTQLVNDLNNGKTQTYYIVGTHTAKDDGDQLNFGSYAISKDALIQFATIQGLIK